MRRDEGDQREDHDAHKHPRQRAAPPRPLRLHGCGILRARRFACAYGPACSTRGRARFSPQAFTAIGFRLAGLERPPGSALRQLYGLAIAPALPAKMLRSSEDKELKAAHWMPSKL